MSATGRESSVALYISVDDSGMMERQVISKCYSKIDTSTSQNQIKQ